MRRMAAMVERMLPDRLAQEGLSDLVELHVHEDDGELPWMRAEGDVLWIEQITSDTPRHGHGRRAMAELCMLADEQDCRLALNPCAQMRHADALRQDELERFYQSLGFGWRRDHVMTRDPMAPTMVNVRYDVAYLPIGNRVELIFDDCETRDDLTRTAFALPVMEDGAVVMANNRRRRIEVPGGHIDPGERADQAASREVLEETGATIDEPIPLGHLRMTSTGEAPPHWRYPHPLSYQMFYAGKVTNMTPYVENDECLAPRIMQDIASLKPHVRLIARRARWLTTRA